MIVFELICPEQHRFEGWFSSGADFDSQKGRGLLECPLCGKSDIAKLPTAKIRRQESAPAPTVPAPAAAPASTPVTVAAGPGTAPTAPGMPTLQQLVEYVLANTENVGKDFAEEARKIHYKEAPERQIRGIATCEETKELLDEGIPVMPLPIPTPGDLH